MKIVCAKRETRDTIIGVLLGVAAGSIMLTSILSIAYLYSHGMHL